MFDSCLLYPYTGKLPLNVVIHLINDNTESVCFVHRDFGSLFEYIAAAIDLLDFNRDELFMRSQMITNPDCWEVIDFDQRFGKVEVRMNLDSFCFPEIDDDDEMMHHEIAPSDVETLWEMVEAGYLTDSEADQLRYRETDDIYSD